MKLIPDQLRNDQMWEEFLLVVATEGRKAYETTKISGNRIADLSMMMENRFATTSLLREHENYAHYISMEYNSAGPQGDAMRRLAMNAFLAGFALSLHNRAPHVRRWVEACAALHFLPEEMFPMMLEAQFGIDSPIWLNWDGEGGHYARIKQAFEAYADTFRKSVVRR